MHQRYTPKNILGHVRKWASLILYDISSFRYLLQKKKLQKRRRKEEVHRKARKNVRARKLGMSQFFALPINFRNKNVKKIVDHPLETSQNRLKNCSVKLNILMHPV